MDIGNTRIEAGAVTFALHHRYLDGGAPHTQGAGGRGNSNPTQGVCIQVAGNIGGRETELLRFDCFDGDAHYHYGPVAERNARRRQPEQVMKAADKALYRSKKAGRNRVTVGR